MLKMTARYFMSQSSAFIAEKVIEDNFMKTKTISYLLAISALWSVENSFALVPLEGLLKGDVKEDIQFDPMSLVFEIPQSSAEGQRLLHKRYLAYLEDAQRLKNSCDHVATASYAVPSQETLARRSVVATFQYIGLDLTVKAIGHYARTLQMEDAEYQKMTENLVKSSCSPNLSVYGIKLIKQNLVAAYQSSTIPLPQLPGQPFNAKRLSEKVSSITAKENEFHHTTQLFRAFCSWGGDTNNYRLLPPLLKNPAVMSWLYRHLENQSLSWDEKSNEVKLVDGVGAVQVSCQDYLCRQVPNHEFNKKFPRTVGSTGLKQDLQRLWCHHFRYQDLSGTKDQHPLVREWIKKIDPEHERQMASQLVSLVTNVSDLLVTNKTYVELKEDLRAGIDERWDQWAQKSLAVFSKDMLYEESLEIKVRPRRDPALIKDRLFAIEMSVTLGELDRVIENDDKLGLTMNLKLSRSWLRWLRVQWSVLNKRPDPEAREAFIDEIAMRLKPQVDGKQKYFPTPLFGEGLEQILAGELIEQVLLYQGPLFDSYEDKMLEVPVRLQYGMFALSYMRYKAVIKGKHKTLDL